MKILLLSQYYYPESLFKGLIYAKELVRQGHQVEVLTGFPNYPGGKLYPGYKVRFLQREVIEGIPVIRVPLYPSHDASAFPRMLNYLGFALSAALIGPWVVTRPDVIYAYHGHATIGLPAWTIGFFRRAPYVLDIQDLWPDSIVASGMLPSWLKPVIPALELWCKFIYRQAAKIAVLSKGFKTTLVSRGVPEAKVQVIPNWCNDDVLTAPGSLKPEEEALLAGRFNIVMAGNMGVMQGLDVVLDAAMELAGLEPQVQFVLVGSGLERPHLEQRAASLGLTNVLFLPKRPIQEIGALLSRAEALLVHLKDDPLFAITIPSRIQAYLAVGRPILCGVRGNAAELVQEAEAGISFESGDPSSLVEAVRSLCALQAKALEEMGNRGREFYQGRLSLPVGTRALIELLSQARQS